jgi:transposase
MRYELTDYEWAAIRPMLPNKPRGVPRVNDRRVLNGIFWVLRSGAPWRDLPESSGPYTTCYNRFVRWRRAGVWGRIMNALAGAHDAAVQMIDTSVIAVVNAASLDFAANCLASAIRDIAAALLVEDEPLTTSGVARQILHLTK